jgi:hypothetical protein
MKIVREFTGSSLRMAGVAGLLASSQTGQEKRTHPAVATAPGLASESLFV